MWIQMLTRAVSIVQAPDGRIQIRGRRYEDVAGLGHEVLQTDQADYRYRILVSLDDLLAIMAHWGREVKYGNFKHAVQVVEQNTGGAVGVSRAAVYGRVYNELFRLDDRVVTRDNARAAQVNGRVAHFIVSMTPKALRSLAAEELRMVAEELVRVGLGTNDAATQRVAEWVSANLPEDQRAGWRERMQEAVRAEADRVRERQMTWIENSF